MSNPDHSIVQETAEEIDASDHEGVMVSVEERVDIAEPSISSEEEDLSVDSNTAHRNRLRVVRAVEKQLSKREGLKWYEIAGSHLDHGKADLIRERSGMPNGFDMAMPDAEARAHTPPEGYHTFYTDQIDMGLRFPIPQTIQQFCQYFSISPSQLLLKSYAILLSLGVLLV